jgi:cytoskeletal protein RodZ
MSARHDSAQPRVRSGAHRTRRSMLGALMPSVLAVAAVASLITALAVWQGEQPDQPRADAAARPATGTATASARTDPAKAVSTPSSTATSTPETSPETTPATEVEGTKAEATPSPTPSSTKSSVDRVAHQVVVLNQSSRAGLAASVGQELRDQGWTVPAVGNFHGIVPSTTVYYPAGAETAALAVAGDLRSEPRIRPRFGNLSTTRLTVVVTTSYPG